MSRLKVGQRVRVKYVENECNKALVGAEGTVTQIIETKDEIVLYGLDISPLQRVGSFAVGLMREQLEPANYDGNDLVEWSGTLWQPETEEAL